MEITEIEISKLGLSEFNVRKNLEVSALDNLANSIKENGLLQPILVKIKNKTKFELIAGQRRLLACKKLGWEKIPAIIFEKVDDRKALTLSTVENLQRVDLNPIEKMNAFLAIYQMFNKDIKAVAKATSYSESRIRIYLNLRGLSQSIKDGVMKGEILEGVKTLETLAKYVKEEEHQEVLGEIKGANQKERVEYIKTISRIGVKEEEISFREKLRSISKLKEFTINIFFYRSQLLLDLARNEQIFRNIREFYKHLSKKVENLKSTSPILKLILDRHLLFKEFKNYFMKQEFLEKPEIERCVYDIEYEPMKYFDILIKDYELNSSQYDDNIKKKIINDLRSMLSNKLLRWKAQAYLDSI